MISQTKNLKFEEHLMSQEEHSRVWNKFPFKSDNVNYTFIINMAAADVVLINWR